MKYHTPKGTFNTLGQAAKAHGVSGEAVRRRFLLNKYPDYTRELNGQLLPKMSVMGRDIFFNNENDWRAGPRPTVWKSGPDPAKHQYYRSWCQQRNQANFRKEGWDFTFEDWLTAWGDLIHQKGQGQNQYCMKRKDRSQPWTKDNVKIVIRAEQSSYE